jgi:putative pyruvate formate lyase activating enzyme
VTRVLPSADKERPYVGLYRSGELQRRAELAWRSLGHCELCPHRCGVDRPGGELGRCRSGAQPVVASRYLHPWEEPPISGTRGSGTIFFSGCAGRCVFCQNYPISQLGVGREVGVKGLAEMMLDLQRRGAHNINFVTPSHWAAAFLAALPLAVERGLRLPLLYNASGYERVETLYWLEDVIDIWLPDSKYADDDVANRLSGMPDYVRHNRAALLEMFRQVGPELVLDDQGIAVRGMIVRHLVLPGGLAGTAQVMAWLADNLSRQVHVSLMNQYFPAHLVQPSLVGPDGVAEDPLLGRKVTEAEYDAAFDALSAAGLENGWVQGEQGSSECD